MLENLSIKSLVAAFVVIFTLIKVTQLVQKELKIRSLGGHTRRVKTWIPFGTYLSHQLAVAGKLLMNDLKISILSPAQFTSVYRIKTSKHGMLSSKVTRIFDIQ